jgi:hypothetical protein
VLRTIARRFEHHGDLALPLFTPGGQALEAVEDLEGAVIAGDNADGQRGQLGHRRGADAGGTRA